jgi:SAM-dependent methyltransferase
MDDGMKSLRGTEKSRDVWDEYYKSIELGDVGNLYPNEPLIRIISTLKKGINLHSIDYFDDKGEENSNRSGFVGNALEIGFGHVSNLMMFNDKGFSCTGLEVSNEAVCRGNLRLSKEAISQESIRLVEWTDLTKLPFEDNSFDFIYGLQCLYYNVDLINIIGEINRCLAPGGHFAFSFFSKNHDYQKFIDVIEEKENFDIVKWSENHPNSRIKGAILAQPTSKEDLCVLFDCFSEKRVFTEDSDFSPTFNSWWYIYGRK